MGAWIETLWKFGVATSERVASYVGAWIETSIFLNQKTLTTVASYVGAWIETSLNGQNKIDTHVASYVGAWIETFKLDKIAKTLKSHPMWVRGLKLKRSARLG